MRRVLLRGPAVALALAIVNVFLAALEALRIAAVMCRHLRMFDDESALEVLAGATLVVGSGRAALSRLQGGHPAASVEAFQRAVRLLSAQTRAAHACFGLAEMPLFDSATLAACATRVFSPGDTTRWLAEAAAVMAASALAVPGPGLAEYWFWSSVLNSLLDTQGHSYCQLTVAVAADTGLQRSLVQLLAIHVLPGLPAQLDAAAAAAGEADGGAGSNEQAIFLLQTVSWAASLLRADCLQPAVRQHFRDPQQAAALRQMAERLADGVLTACPAEGLQDTRLGSALNAALGLLQQSVEALAWQRPAPSSSACTAAERSAAWVFVRLLPRLADVLRVLHGCGKPSHICMDLCTTMATGFDGQRWRVTQDIGSRQEALTLFAGADSALRLLPVLLEDGGHGAAAAACGGGLVGGSAEDSFQMSCQMARGCLAGTLSMLFYSTVTRMISEEAGMRAGDQAAVAAASRQLVVTACRLVWWCEAGGAAAGEQQRRWSRVPGSPASLLKSLQHAAYTCDALHDGLFETLGADPERISTVQTLQRKRTAAMAAASEAFLSACFRCNGGEPIRGMSDRDVAGGLADIISRGPACVPAQHPELVQQLATHAIAALEAESSPAGAVVLAISLLRQALAQPRVLVGLVAHGLLDAVLAPIQQLRPADMGSQDAGQVVRLALLAVRTFDRLLNEAESLVQHGQHGVEHDLAKRAVEELQQQLPEGAAGDVQEAVTQLGQLQECLPHAKEAARILQQAWQAGAAEELAAARLEVAQAAATRCCANLRCPNVEAPGGPDAGKQPDCKKCGGCNVARYCSAACSVAGWRRAGGGHRLVCAALAAERMVQKAQQQALPQ